MKRILLVIMLISFFLLHGCSKEKNTVYDSSNNLVTMDEDITENETDNTIDNVELTEEQCKRIVIDCFDYYYQKTDMEASVNFNEKSFYVWCPTFNGDGGYETGDVGFVQYKNNPSAIYYNNTMIWNNDQPLYEPQYFKREDYPSMLMVTNGPIRIREDHNTNSKELGKVNNGEYYLYFEMYEDNKYRWYKIYLSETDIYAWIASDKNNPWVSDRIA